MLPVDDTNSNTVEENILFLIKIQDFFKHVEWLAKVLSECKFFF